jgi:hypothetical protein
MLPGVENIIEGNDIFTNDAVSIGLIYNKLAQMTICNDKLRKIANFDRKSM